MTRLIHWTVYYIDESDPKGEITAAYLDFNIHHEPGYRVARVSTSWPEDLIDLLKEIGAQVIQAPEVNSCDLYLSCQEPTNA